MSFTPKQETKTLTIIITEGPYRSQYIEIAHNIVESALNNQYNVNLFLYMDATHIPKKNQNPHSFPNVVHRLKILIEKGCRCEGMYKMCHSKGSCM
ncbi:DsrE family protein [Methanobacterium lacus]|uniref:DsrE family protein n=1 Tax=Methanobacterium lacus (strain AL-21) TaxID=877455 RepID=UPI002234FF05|nr:DsrE family protein [Methanobacterium lacus]